MSTKDRDYTVVLPQIVSISVATGPTKAHKGSFAQKIQVQTMCLQQSQKKTFEAAHLHTHRRAPFEMQTM